MSSMVIGRARRWSRAVAGDAGMMGEVNAVPFGYMGMTAMMGQSATPQAAVATTQGKHA